MNILENKKYASKTICIITVPRTPCFHKADFMNLYIMIKSNIL